MNSPQNKSILIAGCFALAITGWIGSGFFKETPANEARSVLEKQSAAEVHVQVSPITLIDHPKVIRLFGETQADRTITLKAETQGRIKELLALKGQTVEAGAPLAVINMDDRAERLDSARALLRQRQLQYEAALKLSEKSFRSQTSLAENRANLSQARANLQAIEIDIERTTLKAPFAGRIEDNHIEVGDYLKVAEPAFTLVDLDPIVITGFVSEQNIGLIKDAQHGNITLSDGTKLDGTVRFIARVAEETTRTYRVELESPNPDNRLAIGQTAEISLPVSTQPAMIVSPALLSLSKTGQIGLKTVNADNIVEFHPITLLDDTPEGIWVKGLPENSQLITRGQDYVIAGQAVIPSLKDAE